MPGKNICGLKVDLDDDRTLKCALPAGHDGPVHRDADDEAWGDPTLPPHPADLDATSPD